MYLDSLFNRIDPEIEAILQKSLDFKQISEKEAEILFKVTSEELFALLFVADILNKQIHQNKASYVLNRNINFTNICENKCHFCGFRRDNDSFDAYTLNKSQIFHKIEEAKRIDASEICIQGGLNPKLNLDYILNLISDISNTHSDLHIHAFSPMEIHYYAKKADLSTNTILLSLKEAGLGSICGTAAEILDDSVRKEICPQKIDSKTWINIIKEAHEIGLPSTSTMLYGHIEDAKLRINHLKKLKEIQSDTKSFTEFIPLRFIHGKTKLSPSTEPFLDLKMISISRLYFLDSIKNIQASWVKLGPDLASLCLKCGANDLGGTLVEENIIKCARKDTNTLLTEANIVNLINSVGLIPKRRDTLYSHQNSSAQ